MFGLLLSALNTIRGISAVCFIVNHHERSKLQPFKLRIIPKLIDRENANGHLELIIN